MRKQLVIAGIVGAMVVADLAHFLVIGERNIVNWHSFVHPFWVISTVVLLTIATFVDRSRLWRALFGLYFLIFFASYINQYFWFTDVLTYNCMLFNAIFASVFYLSDRS